MTPPTGTPRLTYPRAQEPLPSDLLAKIEKLCDKIDSSRWGATMLEQFITDLCLEARRAPSADTRRLNDTPLFVSMIAGDGGHVLALAENGAVYMAEPNSFRPEEWALCVMPPNIRAAIDAAMTQEGE